MKCLHGTSLPKDVIPKAIELTQKALAMNGSLADAHSLLGVLYSWSGRYDEGIAEAERGVELDPNSGQANFNLAVVLRWAGKPKEAIPVFQKALRLEPMAPDNYNRQLALVYFQTGDCKEAIAACEKGAQASAGPSEFPTSSAPLSMAPAAGKRRRGKKDPKSSGSTPNSLWSPL